MVLLFQVQESHIWFNKAVARWLDIALYKAMQRIIKVLVVEMMEVMVVMVVMEVMVVLE